MNNYNSWQAYIQQMVKRMEQQQQMIEQLQKRIEEMSLNEKPKTVIEKIEYHFDQLKIETLEGTLQIGLTPNGSDLSDVGELYSHNSNPSVQHDDILHNLHDYMTKDIPIWMDQYVKDYDIPINPQHKERIISDVRKQLPQRVHFYRDENPDMDDRTLLHQIQGEIRDSMSQYFHSIEGGEK